MPIRYAQDQGDDGGFEDMLLGNMMSAAAASRQAAEQKRSRDITAAYYGGMLSQRRNENARAQAMADKQYGLQLAAEARAKAENEARLKALGLQGKQAEAATLATEAGIPGIKAQGRLAETQADTAALGLKKTQEDLEKEKQFDALQSSISGKMTSLQNRFPLAFDYDSTVTDARLRELDPDQAEQWIGVRNRVREDLGGIVSRMNALRPGSGDVFMQRMNESNARADAQFVELSSGKAFDALAKDSLMVVNSETGPTAMSAWYQSATARKATGQATSAQLMNEYFQLRQEQSDLAIRIGYRSSLQSSVVNEIQRLQGQMQQMPPGLRSQAERMVSELSGLAATLPHLRDGKEITEASTQFGKIISGGGQLELTPELAGVIKETMQPGVDPILQSAGRGALNQIAGFEGAFEKPATPPAPGGAFGAFMNFQGGSGGGTGAGGGGTGFRMYEPPPETPPSVPARDAFVSKAKENVAALESKVAGGDNSRDTRAKLADARRLAVMADEKASDARDAYKAIGNQTEKLAAINIPEVQDVVAAINTGDIGSKKDLDDILTVISASRDSLYPIWKNYGTESQGRRYAKEEHPENEKAAYRANLILGELESDLKTYGKSMAWME